jgi:transposase
MQHYVGLDVSLKQTAVCVVDQTGKIKREAMVASDPDAIAQFMAAHAPDAVRIGLESGATSTWLWTELNKRGLPVICIDARHAKAALKMQINKSDRNDAAGIARIMQCGWYREVRVKDLDSHAIRALLSSRALLVQMKRTSLPGRGDGEIVPGSARPEGQSALHTLVRQSHQAPSCGGFSPNAERTVGPARTS